MPLMPATRFGPGEGKARQERPLFDDPGEPHEGKPVLASGA